MTPHIMLSGLTRPADAIMAVEMGVTHVGCEIVPESPRGTSPSEAKEVFLAAGKKIPGVLFFRTATAEAIREAAKIAGTKHVAITGCGEDTAQSLEGGGFTVYRVVEVPTGTNLLPPLLPEPSKKSQAILTVATTAPNLTFPWEILGNEAPLFTWVAGAVRPENVCALLTHHPHGIIVNSGVEREPGLKDEDRLALFFDSLLKGF